MAASLLFLKALIARLVAPWDRWTNRLRARRSRLGGPPEVAETLPEPVMLGDAERGQALVDGAWTARGQTVRTIDGGSIWAAALPDPRLEAARQACPWLDDLAALGNRPARMLAQAWVQDWISRYGRGSGAGWRPELAGQRAMRWTAHARLLTEGLDRASAGRFWRALAGHQRYLAATWEETAPGLPRLRALAGLVWTGLVLPNRGHPAALAEMAALAEALVDADGGTPSRSPEELAEIVILLIWTARLLEDAGQHAMGPHLQAIVRAVPTLRPLRLGDGALGRFQGGGAGSAQRIDQALAELRLTAQPKPRLPMGYARLSGGRLAVLLDGAPPPAEPTRACAGTLAFEMTAGRERLVVNVGPGGDAGADWALAARRTAAHSAVEVDGSSSARLVAAGLAARTFGPRLVDGPAHVSVRQAQDATGQWLLATQDGYVASHGLLQERRLFVDARGRELRGEDILTVADARGRARFERQADGDRLGFAVRFHLHPAVRPELDAGRQIVLLTLASGDEWLLRAAGGAVELEESVYFDADAALPRPTAQVVVRAEVVEYLGQVTWSIGRLADAT